MWKSNTSEWTIDHNGVQIEHIGVQIEHNDVEIEHNGVEIEHIAPSLDRVLAKTCQRQLELSKTIHTAPDEIVTAESVTF